jgi:hypothetical protein
VFICSDFARYVSWKKCHQKFCGKYLALPKYKEAPHKLCSCWLFRVEYQKLSEHGKKTHSEFCTGSLLTGKEGEEIYTRFCCESLKSSGR